MEGDYEAEYDCCIIGRGPGGLDLAGGRGKHGIGGEPCRHVATHDRQFHQHAADAEAEGRGRQADGHPRPPGGLQGGAVAAAAGEVAGNQVSFETHNYAVSYINNVLQPTDTNKWSHSKYEGTVNGDTIKGKVERDSYMGNKRTMDFEARRVR